MRLATSLVLAASVACCVASASDSHPHQDKTLDTKLEPGSVVERDLAGGGLHTYFMALADGQYVELIVEQRGIDVVVQFLDAQGKVIADFDSESRRHGREYVGFVADSSATCQLRVKASYPKDPAGHYEIQVAEVRAANEKDRALYEAHRLSTEAAVLNDAGKYDDAIARAAQALDMGEKALGPDDAYVGALAIKLGLFLRTKGEFARARVMLERAVNISQRRLGPEDPQTAAALDTLGLVYRSTSDNAKADQLFQQALEITEKSLGDAHPRVARYLMQLAAQHQDRGDFARAIPELQRALAITEKTLEPDDFLSIALLHNLGDIYLNQDDLDHAEPLTQRALEMMEKKYGPEHPNLTTPLQNLGAIARERQQYPRALELLWRAHKIREKTLGPQHPLTAALLLNIGNVYKDERQYEKARELYQQALGILETSAGPYHSLTLMAVANLSSVYSAQGEPIRALEYQARMNQAVEKNIELNLAIGSERAKLAYTESMATRTNRALSIHLREAPNDKFAVELAALVLLQRKARVFDAMADGRVELRQHLRAEDQKLLDELSSLTAKLAKVALSGPGKTAPSEYSKQLNSLEEQRDKLEEEISVRSSGYYQRSSAVSLAAVRAAIPADAVLVDFAIYQPFDAKAVDTGDAPYGDPRYVAYVIPRQGDIRWNDFGSAKEIDGAVRALREALRDPRREDVRQLARVLDERIMQPIRGLTGGATHLLISPDGELNLVPFEALLDQDGHYLVERYSTSYLTTGRDLLRMQVARQSKNEPLIVANPFFGEPGTGLIAQSNATPSPRATSKVSARRSVTTGADLSAVYFAPLAATAQEARTIQLLFPEAKLLTGTQVTQSAIKQVEAPRILHIATHGFFLQDEGASASSGTRGSTPSGGVTVQNPLLRSGLALSGANLSRGGGGNNDGILTALEASNLNLWGTKLVTLSACDTGVGEIKNGEGVFGLRRAFFLAGTESLVMSLWPVSDYVTRWLMTDYYTGLKRSLGRNEALRQAQLAMLKRKGRQHPFYWASFIQSGEWANLDGKR